MNYIKQLANEYVIEPTEDYIILPISEFFRRNSVKSDYEGIFDYQEEEIILEIEQSRRNCNIMRVLDNKIKVEETYTEHINNSLSYSKQSFQASFYFLVNAFIPKYFTCNGDTTIDKLNDILKAKNN